MSTGTTILTEEYRPQTLDEVVGQTAAVQRFRRFLAEGMPHVLLAGPPGVGKTALIVSFARDLFGETFKSNFREFNASDERGIDVVRDDIKSWCRQAPAGERDYKIVFLDEADQLTSDAQPALRRIMEQYSDTTRFALSCNYPNQIIDPLESRTATMHFGRLSDSEVREGVERVIEGEGIDAEEEAVETVVSAADGQLRDALLTVQTSVIDGELTEEQVVLFVGVVDDDLVTEILLQALDGDLDTAQRRFDVELLKEGANPDALIDAVFRALGRLDLPPDQRAKCYELLATIEERIQSGLNPHVQFHALLGHIYMAQGLSSIYQQTD